MLKAFFRVFTTFFSFFHPSLPLLTQRHFYSIMQSYQIILIKFNVSRESSCFFFGENEREKIEIPTRVNLGKSHQLAKKTSENLIFQLSHKIKVGSLRKICVVRLMFACSFSPFAISQKFSLKLFTPSLSLSLSWLLFSNGWIFSAFEQLSQLKSNDDDDRVNAFSIFFCFWIPPSSLLPKGILLFRHDQSIVWNLFTVLEKTRLECLLVVLVRLLRLFSSYTDVLFMNSALTKESSMWFELTRLCIRKKVWERRSSADVYLYFLHDLT